jgi:exodeoxyribonuclease VII large subunit
MEKSILHVADYLALLNEVLHDRVPSNEILIEGEISDYRVAQQKWVSFDLKDEKAEAVLKCFATIWQITTPIEDGMRVHVTGFPKMYERFGTLKLNVQTVEPIGEGALKRAYDLLKKKLEAEGLFDVSRKRMLSRFPKKIGLITSRDAAAYGDFLRIVNNRWGGIEIEHAHVHVQGREAVGEILGAFRYFNTLSLEDRPDAIVLTRGGGGLEDLHAFNDEQVARAVYQSVIPVVVAVGHERDESLADFVADIRASTPSNAAERVVPSRADVKYEIGMMLQHNEHQLHYVMDEYRTAADKVATRVGHILEKERVRLSTVQKQLQDRVENWLPNLRESIESSARVLRQVDPTRILARGYAIVRAGGAVVRDASVLAIGEEIGIQLGGGSVDAEVLRINGKGKQKLV